MKMISIGQYTNNRINYYKLSINKPVENAMKQRFRFKVNQTDASHEFYGNSKPNNYLICKWKRQN